MLSSLNYYMEKNKGKQADIPYPLTLSFFFCFYRRLGAVMCMGVTAGAYILTLFAVSQLPWHSIENFHFSFLSFK